MAALFAVGLPFTYDGTTNHFATTTGGSATVAAVTSADDVTVDSLSGNATLTIGATWSCNTLTINNASATVACDGTHGITSASTVTLTAGTLNTNGQTCSWLNFSSNNSNTRTLTMGASNITVTGSGTSWTTSTNTNLTITTNTATITFTGAAGSMVPGSAAAGTGTPNGNYEGASIVASGSGAFTFTVGSSSGATFANITRTGTAAKTDSMTTSGPLTATSTMTLTGNSVTNRLLITTTAAGTNKIFTAAAISLTNVDIMDITGAGLTANAAWTGTSLGDAGGNVNITFDTPVAQTWSGTSGGNWSTNAWTTRVPLPQDDVTFGIAFSASQTVTVDMPRIGRSVDLSGCTGSPVWTWQNAIRTNYGSFTGPSNGTFTSFSGIVMSGRGSYTIDQKGLGLGTTISAPSGTYTATSTFSTGSGGFGITAGTFDANNFNVSVGAAFTCTGAITRAFRMGSGIWTLSGTGSVFSVAAGGLTMTAGTSTLIISNTSVTTKTISCSGGGQTFYNLQINGAASAAAVTIAGANTFNNITGQANAHLTLPSSITTTASSLTSQGTAGNLFVLDASVAGTAATLYSPSYLRTEYLSVKDNTAAGATPFSAGDNGTLVSGTTNWITVSHATLFNDYQFVHAGDGMSVTEGIR